MSAFLRPLEVIDRGGPEPFWETLALQRELVARKIADSSRPDGLIFVEHESVYTVGRGEPFQSVAGIPWVETNRGGKATYHGPGQLVAYPIFDLNVHGRDVHRFLRNLEGVVIHALREFDVKAFRREGFTGVWVLDRSGVQRKIASLGIGISRWISYHGLALNVTTALSYFRAISPCGEVGESMTSLAALQTPAPAMSSVKLALESAFRFFFRFENRRDNAPRIGKPKWLRVRAPGSRDYRETQEIVRRHKLATVCEEAHCPNRGECWSHGTATFMIMGELCTRRCAFCAVKEGTARTLEPLDPLEPYRVGRAVKELGLCHVVITSVDRDDLPDQGAAHFNQTVRAVRAQNPECRIELLIPDMRGNTTLVIKILESGEVSVLNHNVETVPRLYREVRPGASFSRSLAVLRAARGFSSELLTKSGVMLGLGEQREEVLEVLSCLRDAGCNIVTIGQYLQPSSKQLPVQRFVPPEEFEEYQTAALRLGFSYVESGPLVRSSYHAWKHTALDGPRTGCRANTQ